VDDLDIAPPTIAVAIMLLTTATWKPAMMAASAMVAMAAEMVEDIDCTYMHRTFRTYRCEA
jgi:hypothetical protein